MPKDKSPYPVESGTNPDTLHMNIVLMKNRISPGLNWPDIIRAKPPFVKRAIHCWMLRPLVSYLIVIVLIAANSIASAQPQLVNPPGTRLRLTLPDDFRYVRSISGYFSTMDSSVITITEVSNPYTFDELLGKRLRNLTEQGLDTYGFRSTVFHGYRGMEFTPPSPEPLRKTFALMFGSDEFMADIQLFTTAGRFESLKNMLYEANYDASVMIDEDGLRGFGVSYEGTGLRIFKQDANTINARETDGNGNVIAWLNLTKMPAAMYGDVTAEEAIDATYKMYRFDKHVTSSDTETIDHASLLSKLYSVERGGSTEFYTDRDHSQGGLLFPGHGRRRQS